MRYPALSQQETAYHVELLAEAGFLQAKRLVTFQLYDWKPTRLTYAGHEFLDTVRDNEIWRLTKEGAQKVGAHSVTFLFEVGKAILKQKAVEHGISLLMCVTSEGIRMMFVCFLFVAYPQPNISTVHRLCSKLRSQTVSEIVHEIIHVGSLSCA